MKNEAQKLAKLAGITEQQAVTAAVIVRSHMRSGMTMADAVESYMSSMRALAKFARADG